MVSILRWMSVSLRCGSVDWLLTDMLSSPSYVLAVSRRDLQARRIASLSVNRPS